jgi:anthranilate phosphoribosyltransferase
MGIPTCFNLLGPLINPSHPTYQMLGVADLAQMRLYHSALQRIDVDYCIVNSTDGYDEISLTGPFKVQTRDIEKVYTPADLGLPATQPSDIYGGETSEEAKAIFDHVLEGTATPGQTDTVLANAAFAIHLIDKDKSLSDCLATARESIESGKAIATLRKYIEINS